jgi:hypothetical protein
VSSRTHAQLEKEDPTDEGAKVEGGSGQEGKRRTLQHYSAYVPDKARVKGKGEGQHPLSHPEILILECEPFFPQET